MRHQCVFQIGKILEFKNTKCLECKQRELSHIVLELQIKIILENNLPLSKLNVCIPRNPAIPFVAILKNICALENMKQYKSTHLLIICITARNWNLLKCPSQLEWKNCSTLQPYVGIHYHNEILWTTANNLALNWQILN